MTDKIGHRARAEPSNAAVIVSEKVISKAFIAEKNDIMSAMGQAFHAGILKTLREIISHKIGDNA